jgi:hypothetical protein
MLIAESSAAVHIGGYFACPDSADSTDRDCRAASERLPGAARLGHRPPPGPGSGTEREMPGACGGMLTLPASGYITIPAALRHRCGLEPGDQVLLAAPRRGRPRAYSLAVVDQAIRAHGAFPHTHGGQP